MRLNADVHQAHKELKAGWGNLIDFQLCIENFQVLVQWYHLHSMNIISCDDKFLWWLLMFGRMKLRHWDPGIPWNDIFAKVEGTFGYL